MRLFELLNGFNDCHKVWVTAGKVALQCSTALWFGSSDGHNELVAGQAAFSISTSNLTLVWLPSSIVSQGNTYLKWSPLAGRISQRETLQNCKLHFSTQATTESIFGDDYKNSMKLWGDVLADRNTMFIPVFHITASFKVVPFLLLVAELLLLPPQLLTFTCQPLCLLTPLLRDVNMHLVNYQEICM